MNSGDIIATGGAGTGATAYGGDVEDLFMTAGGQVTNSGDIYMDGGAGTEDGGDGGFAAIGSETTATENSGVITVAGGLGGSDDGDGGDIWIDGFLLTSGHESEPIPD